MITVDGIDLHHLGLDDVRSRSLCIIPQDPVLFSGPLRYNFDPFGQYNDNDIWTALEQVNHSSLFKASPSLIDSLKLIMLIMWMINRCVWRHQFAR
jgi:ABC-type multidrug transport system fused ATPase/permease subunit